MKLIDVTTINNWRVASKTRPIRAKALVNLLVDPKVINKFLLDTLEGREPLGDGVMVCVGEAGDVWQQMPGKLLKKYRVVDSDRDGWLICEPLPDNAVNAVEVVRPDWLDERHQFHIQGHYGETVDGVSNVQHGAVNDIICQNRADLTDVWIVRRRLFYNTYVWKS